MQYQQHRKVLLVLNVNRPAGHHKSTQWQTQNASLVHHLSQLYTEKIDLSADHQLLKNNRNSQYDVLLLNFNAVAFNANKGVGLARKIAADTLLALIENKVINKPWIFSTDADVVLPKGYFDSIMSLPAKVSALSMAFEHVCGDPVQAGLQRQYDFKLKYYQQAVQFVGADYAYVPLGSTLVIEANSYAKVRGFPCKSGGEDFYILNKLAKIGQVHQPKKPIIEIQSRFSDRVPFGTGPAISQIQQLQTAGEVMVYYHPEIFHVLKSWRNSLVTYYSSQRLSECDLGLNDFWKIENVLQQAFSQVKSIQRWQQFVHEWFDAFKVLKSVHFLREVYESISLDALTKSAAYQAIARQ